MVVLHEANLTNDTEQPPPRKRNRQEQPAPLTNKSVNDQRLFAPFRALGLITNHVPFVLQTRSHKGAIDGPKVHILTCLGRSWALWEGGKMTLLFVGEYAYIAYGNNLTGFLNSQRVGPDLPEQISSMLMDGDAVWASSGPHVIKYLRGREVSRRNV